ncbi:terminase small subunit [Streptococcus phage STP1]|uniref:Terminase n=2 Tax=Moineauvirus TaxID=1623304 RepID=A0A2P0VG83_9CAUD|nr:terminase small subunit [Streptococcus phage B0]YP_010647709.1 terminase small subunit [Streptococcus phage STP1]ATI19759.1 terminase [Streptococcus phage B5]ATI20052.1 terminase small subunit [Streptococcus phage STP2]ATI19712.1 terminase [Streptococcus phage B0]ATI20011.1 terminase small subunit [Streptococcus phage STP1]
MVKNPYYQQNNGRLPSDPPNYLGTVAREVWRKIVPFLESTNKIQRIDTFLVETYCTNYEIYKMAYEDIKENGIQQEITKPIQAQGSGEILGEQSLGFKKNPAVATMKDAVDTLNRIGVQLGLTPKGRQELMEIAGDNSEEVSIKDKMKEFFN